MQGGGRISTRANASVDATDDHQKKDEGERPAHRSLYAVLGGAAPLVLLSTYSLGDGAQTLLDGLEPGVLAGQDGQDVFQRGDRLQLLFEAVELAHHGVFEGDPCTVCVGEL